MFDAAAMASRAVDGTPSHFATASEGHACWRRDALLYVMIAAPKIIPRKGKLSTEVCAHGDKTGKAATTTANATSIKSMSTKERLKHGEEATAAYTTPEVAVEEVGSSLGKTRDKGNGSQLTAGADAHTMAAGREAAPSTDDAMIKSARVEMALNMTGEGAVNHPSSISSHGRREMAKPVVEIGSDAVVGGGPRVMAVRMEQSLGSK